jgi:HEAT repeat protein
MLKFVFVTPKNHGLRRGAVSGKGVVIYAAAALLAAGAVSILFFGSYEDLLDKETLSPEEIRLVATELLLHPDIEIRTKASKKLTDQGETAVPVLREVGLATSNASLQMALYICLARLNTDAAMDIVEAMMQSDDHKVRLRAVRSASRIHTPRSVALLEDALKHENDEMRAVAAGTIGRIGPADAVPALRKALNDPNEAVRRHAARSLKELTGQDYSHHIDKRRK